MPKKHVEVGKADRAVGNNPLWFLPFWREAGIKSVGILVVLGGLEMRRLVAIVTAVSFGLAAPAFAQNAPVAGTSQQPSQAQPLLLDGQDAMAQQVCDPNTDPNCGPGGSNTGLLVALGVGATIGGVLWAISANQKKSVSP